MDFLKGMKLSWWVEDFKLVSWWRVSHEIHSDLHGAREWFVG
jgi:hypothetical protein